MADFGLAKLVDTRTITSQQGAGTPRWQSPELFYGGPRTFKSDVYAFGMTVYEVGTLHCRAIEVLIPLGQIISGKLPFDDVPDYGVFFKVHNKERPVPTPRVSSSGYIYTVEWEVAKAAWDHEDGLRPSMDTILESLESHNKLGKVNLKARIKVICEQMPHLTGYVSRILDVRSGSQVVTREVSRSLVITWDPKPSDSQVVHMVVSP